MKILVIFLLISLSTNAQETIYTNIAKQAVRQYGTSYVLSFQDMNYTQLTVREQMTFTRLEFDEFLIICDKVLNKEDVDTDYDLVKSGNSIRLTHGTAYTYISKRALNKIKESL